MQSKVIATGCCFKCGCVRFVIKIHDPEGTILHCNNCGAGWPSPTRGAREDFGCDKAVVKAGNVPDDVVSEEIRKHEEWKKKIDDRYSAARKAFDANLIYPGKDPDFVFPEE